MKKTQGWALLLAAVLMMGANVACSMTDRPTTGANNTGAGQTGDSTQSGGQAQTTGSGTASAGQGGGGAVAGQTTAPGAQQKAQVESQGRGESHGKSGGKKGDSGSSRQ